MGSSVSFLHDSIFGKKEKRIFMAGLDKAGKTTLLYKMRLGEVVSTIPTQGFNVETLDLFPWITMRVWDVGGEEKCRELWWPNYHNSDGIIFVVDSTDEEQARLSIAKEALHRMLRDDGVISVPLLVLANKQDLPRSLSLSRITEGLGLEGITDRKWHVQGVCAWTGEGVMEGLNWLAQTISS